MSIEHQILRFFCDSNRGLRGRLWVIACSTSAANHRRRSDPASNHMVYNSNFCYVRKIWNIYNVENELESKIAIK
jgi:hypothetical protein